jgi:hypothetical protein
MNKAEKVLFKKVKKYYDSPNPSASFTRDENIILERWRVQNIINEDAFLDCTTSNSDHKEYLQNRNYPFTLVGEKDISKNWYIHFRESKGITILRDLLTVIAFFVSLILAILKLITK